MHPLATSTAAAALATLLALGARAEPLTVYIGYTSLGIVNTTDEQKECLETTPPVRTETRNVTDTDERTPGACRTRACTESRDIADCPDGTDDIVGAWIQNACSDWTDIECEAPPIECPTPESNVRNHDCPGQTVLKQLRIRQPVIEGDTCVLGEWTEWNPPCSSTDVCPTPETDTRACAGDPSAEQTQARTSSEVNGACTWGAWSQWTPECPREQCRDGTTVATGETCPLSCSDPYGAIGAQIDHACGECTWTEPTTGPGILYVRAHVARMHRSQGDRTVGGAQRPGARTQRSPPGMRRTARPLHVEPGRARMPADRWTVQRRDAHLARPTHESRLLRHHVHDDRERV